MAGFKTHVTVSSLLGCGYAGVGCLNGVPLDTAILGGAMCGFAGMLPDLDSDYGTPLRETMAFTAAVVPMLLIHRFASFQLSPDEMALVGVALYLLIRFGVTYMVRRYTVHRGMFHSIPAGLIFAGVAFLIAGSTDLNMRYYKAGGVLAGFLSHLLLDEIYSIEWKGGRWRIKKSFGTALKIWGDDNWANFSTYAKLIIVGAMIVSEPTVMEQIQDHNPQLADRIQGLENQYHGWSERLLSGAASEPQPITPPPAEPSFNPYAWPPSPSPLQHGGANDTAQRPVWPGTQ